MGWEEGFFRARILFMVWDTDSRAFLHPFVATSLFRFIIFFLFLKESHVEEKLGQK